MPNMGKGEMQEILQEICKKLETSSRAQNVYFEVRKN
jgi:hypothetical protein